jgi:endonuclease/exonuclease/phosphatase (EEP) superfamily protein YafD
MDSKERTVVLSHKEFVDNSLASHKQSGWVFYISGGTWAWNMGSGARRITYERDNGEHMPLNDGRWHQLTMTYDSARSEIRLFYDGHNKVVYNVDDSMGFDFTSGTPLVVGWAGTEASQQAEILPAIHTGAENLQELVHEFNRLGLNEVAPEEFVNLIVEPERFFDQKVDEMVQLLGADGAAFRESMQSVDFGPVTAVEAELMQNPYTTHQAFSFMEVAPLLKIYTLVDDDVVIDESAAQAFTERERLYPPDFDIDNLAIWDRPLSAGEVLDSYTEYFKPATTDLDEEITSITVGAWNIFHGGKHFNVDEHGWDSRIAIAEILKRQNVDVLMMQETYSSGDFIAAELGYYFATTIDWDYLNQGANISVLSRYPIEEVYVEEDSPFMTVATKLAISKTQHLYAMSNWYGMEQFPAVFAFNESRFAESDTIPTVFGGDFNAVPHTDGGGSPASPTMLAAGFTDAFRSLYPDVQENPGATHRNGRRIDQLYYKGAGLRNTSTRLVTTWPTGFPSDHNLILTTFDLNYPGER